MAGARRKAREMALQALYEVDSAGHEVDGVVAHLLADGGLSEENGAFVRELVSGVIHNKEKIDGILHNHYADYNLNHIFFDDCTIQPNHKQQKA